MQREININQQNVQTEILRHCKTCTDRENMSKRVGIERYRREVTSRTKVGWEKVESFGGVRNLAFFRVITIC